MKKLSRTMKIAAMTAVFSLSFTAISYVGQWKQETVATNIWAGEVRYNIQTGEMRLEE